MFKKIIAIVLFALFAVSAHARTFAVGECVGTPTMYVKAAQKLVPEPIVVFPGAFDDWAAHTVISNSPYRIRDIEGQRAFVVWAPGLDNDPRAGRGVGWIRIKDLLLLPEVNCG